MKTTQAEKIIEAMLNGSIPSSYWAAGHFAFPAIEKARHTHQRIGTVFTHTMQVLNCLRTQNPVTLFSALFHDLGKVETKAVSVSGGISFPGHELASSAIALDTLQNWEADPYIIDRVTRIVKTHMVDIANPFSDQAVRKFIAKVGHNNMDNWFVLRYADATSYFGKDKYVTNVIANFEQRVSNLISQSPKEDGPAIDPSTESMRIVGDDTNER